MPIYIKPMSNIDHIKQGCKTCLSVMLLQSDINKWRLSQLAKLDKLYINSASTRLLQRSKNDSIEYKIKMFPNNQHTNWRACDAEPLYHCPYPSNGPKLTKWDCILNCCSDFPGTNTTDLESSEQLDRFFLASFHKKFHIFKKV